MFKKPQIKFYIKVYIHDSYVNTLDFGICSSPVIFGSLLHPIKITCNPNFSDFTISIKFVPVKEIIPSEEGQKEICSRDLNSGVFFKSSAF